MSLLAFPVAAFAQAPPPALVAPAQVPVATGFRVAERTEIVLAPGVTLTQEITPPSAPNGPLVVSVVRITRNAAKNDRLHAALGYGTIWQNNKSQGRESVSGIAARNNALVAVNASFFTYSSGHPLGIYVENGAAVTEPLMNRTALLWDKNGVAQIAAFTGSGTVTASDGATFPLNGLNRKPGKGSELLLFTPPFFGATLLAPDHAEATVSGIDLRFGETFSGTVTATGEGGTSPLSPQTVVVSGSGKGATFLREHAKSGTTLSVRYDVSPPLDAKIRQAVAGGPRLLENSRINVTGDAEGLGGAFSTARHPRTAAGITASGDILLLTVDGRQPTLSRGATLAETAALLLKFGAVNGVNFDGGGSTTLAVRGGVANSPSDGNERAVASAIVLTDAKKAALRPINVVLNPIFNGVVAIGETHRFVFPSNIGREQQRGATWSIVGNMGFVSQSGNFLALRGGIGEVIATLPSGERYSFPVSVPKPPDAKPIPPEDPGLNGT